MTLRIDPDQNEVRALKKIARWRGQHVLEIGCGDGRLTQRLAQLGAQIEAIDLDPSVIRAARKRFPRRLAARVRFRVGKAGRLEYAKESFDLVVFSWVL